MPAPTSTLRLLFFAADHQACLQLLPIRIGQLDCKDEQLPSEVKAYDALIRLINRLLQTDKVEQLGGKICLEDYDRATADPFDDDQIILLFARPQHLRQKHFYEKMLENLRHLNKTGTFKPRPAEPSGDKKTKKNLPWKDTFPNPVVTLSDEDFMSLYAETPRPDYDPDPADATWRERRWLHDNHHLYRYGIDHRVKFLDSSIWHRYLQLPKISGKAAAAPLKSLKPFLDEFAERFTHTLLEIIEYHALGLYRTRTALSSLEFQCRMFLNAYIEAIGSRDHRDAVTPFKFHSETFARQRADLLLDFIEKEGLDHLIWHFFMVDDYSDQVLSAAKKFGNTETLHTTITKKELIDYWATGNSERLHTEIERRLKKEDLQPDPSLIQNLSTRKGLNAQVAGHSKKPKNGKGYIQQAIKSLQHPDPVRKIYDILLLDYLLGPADRPDSVSEKEFPHHLREYGHEFLLELDEHLRRPEGFPRGPLGRVWIFPISTFPYAFQDKLHQLGMDHFNDHWYISRGCDPVCEPEMFRWTLYQFLWQQVSRCYLHPAGVVRWLDRFWNIEKRNDWFAAVKAGLEVEIQKISLLREPPSKHSKFCESITAFLDLEQMEYEKKLEGLIKTAERLSQWQQLEQQTADIKNTFRICFGEASKFEVVLHYLLKKNKDFHQKHPLLLTAQTAVAAGKTDLIYDGGVNFFPVEIVKMGFRTIEIHSKLQRLPEQFVEQSFLENLDLSNNLFSKVPAVIFAMRNNPNIKSINLDGNQLSLQKGINWRMQGKKQIQENLQKAEAANLIESQQSVQLTFEQVRDTTLQFIAAGDLDAAIELLLQAEVDLSVQASKAKQEVIQISGNWQEISKQRRLGTIATELYLQKRSQISLALQGLLENN